MHFKVLIVLSLLVTSLAASSSTTLNDEEQQWVIDNPIITIATPANHPPLAFVSNGEVRGYLPDVIQLLAEDIGFRVNWVSDLNWQQMLEQGKAGNIPMLLGGVKTDERTKYFYYSPPVVHRSLAIYANKTRVPEIADLKQGKAASPKDFFLTERIKADHPRLTVIETDDVEHSFRLVDSGEVDYTIADRPVGAYILNRTSMTNIVQRPASKALAIYERAEHLMISKSYPLLKSIVDKSLANLDPLHIKRLRERWLINLPNINLSHDERIWLENAPTIRVQVSDNYVPFEFIEQDEAKGYSIDLIKLLAEKLSLKLEFIPSLAWQDYLDHAKERNIDVLHSLYQTKDREEYLAFTQSYFHGSPIKLFGRFHTNHVESIEQLFGKVVAVEQGSAPQQFISEQYPKIILKPILHFQDGINSVRKGESDYIICSEVVCDNYIQRSFISNITDKGFIEISALKQSLPMRFAVRSDWPILASLLDKALKSVTAEEETHLRNTWLSGRVDVKALSETLTEEEQSWLDTNGRLTFTTATDAVPYSFVSNNQFLGLSSDILNDITDQFPFEAFFKPASSWAKAMQMLRDGEVDFIPWMYVTKQRQSDFLFTEPYLNDTMSLFTRNDFRFVNSLSDMGSAKIAMLRGSAISEELTRDFPQLRIVYYRTLQDIIEAVSKGQADGLIQSAALVQHVLKTTNTNNLRIASTTPYAYQQALAVHPSKPELVQILNKAMFDMTSKEKSLMLDKWTTFHVVEKRNWTAIIAYTSGTFLILSAIATFMILRNRHIAHQAIARSQQELADAQRIANIGSWEWDANDDSMYWSDEGSRLLSLFHGNRISRKGLVKMIHPDDRDGFHQRWDQAMELGFFQSEHRLLSNGQEKWVKDIAELNLDKYGKVIGASGTTQDIHQQKMNDLKVVESARELQVLTGKLLTVQEEERRRIARELHDDLSQRLAALSIETGTLELDPELAAGKERLSGLKQRLIHIATDVHGLSRRLHPSILDDLGLIDALRSELDSFESREKIIVNFTASTSLETFNKDIELSVFRIVQEATRNVAKYSEASSVQVTLNIDHELLLLQVADDGMGFDVDDAMRSPGLGLQSMSERAKLIGGELNIRSEINKGTVISLKVPMSSAT